LLSKGYMIMAAQAIVADFLATFEEFPPRQKAASFTTPRPAPAGSVMRERMVRCGSA
jgi:hypothetical protein